MKHLTIFLLLISSYNLSAQSIDILSGVKIELRDGTELNSTVYKPDNQQEALPLIVSMTPYISDNYHDRGVYFAKNGYVFAIVDVRGRGSSEGEFDPFMQEAKDGYDVVEFLANQSYCNGKVAMWGGSYAGYNQWATAKELPPSLKTIVPVASVKPGFDFPMLYNIGHSHSIQWLTDVTGKTANDNLQVDNDYWISKFLERNNKGLAFNVLDTLVGNPSEIFQQWLSHPTYDAFYQSMNPTPSEFKKMDLPILTITGSYDDDQPGALSHYTEFMKYASDQAKGNHYLIIGPWDHPGTRTPRKQVGGLTFGDASLLNMNDLHKQWYDYVMKNGEKPSFLKDRVGYYITNRDQWKYVASLEDIGKDKMLLYLNPTPYTGNDIFNSGSLSREIPQKSESSEYIYDPTDDRLALIDQNPYTNILLSDHPLTDQSYVYQMGNQGLVYHSEIFEEDTEVSGFFELDILLETNVRDLDVEADIYEVRADGTSVFLTRQAIRARYKDSLKSEKLLTPSKIYHFNFDKFNFISRVVEKGSRLRLVISSPNSINTQKNYAGGGEISRETKKDSQVANVKIYSGPKNQSVLKIPVVKFNK